MTSIKIGWFGTDIPQSNVSSVKTNDNGIEISGRLSTSDRQELDTLRNQILGLSDQKHLPQPLTVDTDPDLDGWYYVSSSSAAPGDGGSLKTGWWEYQISLTKCPDRGSGLHEARILGSLRSNYQARTTCIGWHAVPSGATGYGGPVFLSPPTMRKAANGSVRVYTAGVGGILNDFASWSMPAAQAMEGGAKISAGKASVVSSATIGFSGTSYSYVVPPGVTKVRVDARGASALVFGVPAGGKGARVVSQINVTPGETLTIKSGGLGGFPAGGWNGGGSGGIGRTPELNGFGGGGRTQVLRGATELIVAGGGGGWGQSYAGGGRFNAGYGGSNGSAGQGPRGGSVAGGGTSGSGGAAGTSVAGGGAPSAGVAGVGGQGGSCSAGFAGGGGGGGVYGGGGGGSDNNIGWLVSPGGSGGGGSSMASGSVQSITNGYQVGPGEVVISPISDSASDIVRHGLTGTQSLPDPFGWQLDNGIVKISPVSQGGSVSVDVSVWTGSKWGAPKRWNLCDNSSSATPASATLTSWSILRNTPERVIIAWNAESGAKSVQLSGVVSLRRGSYLAEIGHDATEDRMWGWRLDNSGYTGTVVTGGGIVASSADSDGVKWLTTTIYLSTPGTSGGAGWYLWINNRNFSVGLGGYPSSESSSAGDLVAQWYASIDETIRMVQP